MRSVNKVILLGTIGGDPKIRTTKDGRKVANLTMVTDRSFKDGDEWREEATWHSITMWRKLADWAEKHVVKGTRLYLEGELRVSNWEDKDGNKRKNYYVNVYQYPIFVGGKRHDAAPAPSPHGYEPESAVPPASGAEEEQPPF